MARVYCCGRESTRTVASFHTVGLMVFSNQLEIFVPLDTNRTVVRGHLEKLRSRHRIASTALRDTLRSAVLQFTQPMPGDSIYAITDGDDDASRTDLRTVEEILVGRGIRLFMLSIESKEYGLTQKYWNRSATHNLVRATGGNSVLISESRAESLSGMGEGPTSQFDDLTTLSQQLQLISTFARVEVELPEVLKKPEDWDLRAVGMTGLDLVVEYPHKLMPCLEK